MRGGKPIGETYFVRIGYLLAMVVRKYQEKKDGATRRCGNTNELPESPEVNTRRGVGYRIGTSGREKQWG
jgi:hypothetical protein